MTLAMKRVMTPVAGMPAQLACLRRGWSRKHEKAPATVLFHD